MTPPILLIGNQNAGKTTLFNALTGLNAKVANYPGITVEARVGQISRASLEKVDIVDLPGTYSLIPASEDEELTVKALFGDVPGLSEHSLVVVVIDSTEMRRGLYLYSQIIELGFKAIIALSMVDQQPQGWSKETITTLQKKLGALAIPVSVNDKKSQERLLVTIDAVLSGALKPQIKKQPLWFTKLPKPLIDKLGTFGPGLKKLPPHATKSADLIRNHNIFLYNLTKRWRLDKTEKDLHHLTLDENDRKALDQLLQEIPEERFRQVDTWLAGIKDDKSRLRKTSDYIDRILLHPVVGSIFLIVLFITLLQTLFLVAQPIADAMGDGIAYLGAIVGNLMPEESMLRSLVMDGIFEGVGSILSFLPLIALLFLFLSLLEDSGYFARATYLLDKTLKRTGLCGRSLVPMLSGFACAVPAVMAARTIGNRKERLITILVTPFLTCSARLPIFGLIVGALFSHYPPLFGVLNVGALMFSSMYALGLTMAVLSAAILSRILKTDGAESLAIDLPPYRWPRPFSIGKRVFDRIVLFVRDVGTVILASTIIIWALFRFEPYAKEKTATPEFIAHSDEVKLENSFAGIIGQSLEPIVRPMGLDWQVAVGILASFLAREVFVSTMAVVYGLEDQNEEDATLRTAFKNHMTPLSGFALLIFFTLSMQCVSTMATTFRETGSSIWPMLQFLMMTGSGYILAVLVYQVGNLFG